jgi:hypothetical protein
MKNIMKIAGILAILLVAGNLSLIAQRGYRGGMKSDSLRMKCDSTCMRMHARQLPGNLRHDSLYMRHGSFGRLRLEPGMRGHMQMMQQGRGMRQMGPRPEMMARGRAGQGDMRRTPGMRMMENIPNLTDKQKEELTKINEKQKEEIQKFRDEQQKELKGIRDAHKEKVKGILTDEQKKWVEENKY